MRFLIIFLSRFYTGLLDILLPPRPHELLVRTAAYDSLAPFLAPRIVETATILLSYRVPLVQALILEAKFKRNRIAQRLLGQLLADYIKVWCQEHAGAAGAASSLVLVPVPLGRKRLKERGYNQVEEVAKYAIEALHVGAIPVPVSIASNILIRTHETAPQMSLGKEARRQNMHGAFRATDRLNSKDSQIHQHSQQTIYFLLDDVLTTGATLSSAAAALRAAGAKHIVLIALAH